MTNYIPTPLLLTGSSSFDLQTRSGENSHWCAIYTYPRHEKTVAEALERKALEVFLPAFLADSQWKDRRVKLLRPLFPGYVFTRIHSGEQLKVLTVSGVVRIVSFQGSPAAISDEEVDSVRRCMKGGAVLEPCPLPALGERVRVRSGVFAGVEGVVISQKNKCKLVISISLVNQSVSFEIDGEQSAPGVNKSISFTSPAPSVAPRDKTPNAIRTSALGWYGYIQIEVLHGREYENSLRTAPAI